MEVAISLDYQKNSIWRRWQINLILSIVSPDRTEWSESQWFQIPSSKLFNCVNSQLLPWTCQDYMQKSHFLRITFSLNISGQKWAIDNIPRPKIIYWEVTTLLDFQKNSVSCLCNFISCYTLLLQYLRLEKSYWQISKA